MSRRDRVEARRLARHEFAKAIVAGKSAKDAGVIAQNAVRAKFPKIDPATIAAILELIKFLIALFSK